MQFIAYHSTKKRFDASQPRTPMFLADDANWTKFWGPRLIKYQVTIDNPEYIRNSGMHIEGLDDQGELDRLAKDGKDGVVISNDNKPTIFMVTKPEQLKLLEDNVQESILKELRQQYDSAITDVITEGSFVNVFGRLFHGTGGAAAEKIKSSGKLIPGAGKENFRGGMFKAMDGAVYLTTNIQYARTYAMHQSPNKDGEVGLVTVDKVKGISINYLDLYDAITDYIRGGKFSEAGKMVLDILNKDDKYQVEKFKHENEYFGLHGVIDIAQRASRSLAENPAIVQKIANKMDLDDFVVFGDVPIHQVRMIKHVRESMEESVVSEGRFDAPTTFIIRKIANEISNKLPKLSKDNDTFEIDLNNEDHGIAVDHVYLSFHYDPRAKLIPRVKHEIEAVYNSSGNFIMINVNVRPDTKVSDLLNVLREVIAHELLHASDTKDYGPENDHASLISPLKYMLRDDEQVAMVNGMYKRAKSSKVPFDTLLKAAISQAKKDEKAEGDMSSQEIDALAKKVYQTLSQVARTRFPELVADKR